MSHFLELTIVGEPVPWQRTGSRGRQRYTRPRCAVHAETIRQAWMLAGRPSFGDAAVVVSAMFYCARSRMADIDNLVKLLLDALTGCLYDDDRQVVCLSGVHKLRVADDRGPRTVLTVWEASRQ